jgi:regulator of sirC expression with transglutaminase-like and TPR domain
MPLRPISNIWLSLSLFLALAIIGAPAKAEPYTKADIASDKNLKAIRAILELPDNQIDLAKVKLSIDHMIDPSINIARTLKQLDAMAAEVKARIPANASSREKVETLRAYLFDKGTWNFRQPFRYDLDDPFGGHIQNKLLSTYLATRKGNCVSMPFLFIILGQKLGIDVTASTMPEHVFVKYRDEAGNLYNIETTSGGYFARDVWLQEQHPMTAKALASGIYMQPLTKKETVAEIADTLNEFYEQQGKPAHSWVLAELEYKYYPKDISAILHMSAASHLLREQFFDAKRRKFPMKKYIDFTEPEEKILEGFELSAVHWWKEAVHLGWREPDKATEAKYRQIVNNAKLEQQ